MLIWAALALAALGSLAVFADLRVAEYFRTHLVGTTRNRVRKFTDLAKGAHWLVVAFLAYGGVQLWMTFGDETPDARYVSDIALAFLVSMLAASAILHTTKLVLGRRRPRDYFEHGLYGVRAFALDGQYDSFPSGHSVTIFCIATLATVVWPTVAPLWFVLAALLAVTRAMLTSHFLSDVLFGAALGVIVARETVLLLCPQLAPPWF